MTIVISGIPIDIHKKNIKNMHLQVKPPEGHVVISAPASIDDKAIEIYALLLRFYNFVCYKCISYLLTYFFREYHFMYPFIFYSIAENVGRIEKGIRTVKNKG